MKFLKKDSISIISLILIISFSMHAMASKKTILVNNLSVAQINKDLLIDFDQELYLTTNIIDGLKNGIPLVFDINFSLIKDNPYWFDDKILVKKSQYKIKYRNLLEKYEVININGEKAFFEELQDGLDYVKKIERWNVGSLDGENKNLLVSLKVKLNKKHLPKPMQINIKDQAWDFQSEEIRKYIEVNN